MEKSSIYKSIAFHVLLVLLLSGAFVFKDDIVVTETPIDVSFAPDSGATKPVKDDKKPIPVKDTPPPIEDKPQPAPKALEQPKPKPPVEIAKKEQEKPAEKKPEPKKEPEKPKEKVAEKPKEIKKKPEPKIEEKKEEPKKAKDEADTSTGFASVLKNLADTQPVDTGKEGPKLTESPTSDRMSTGELDAFRMQLSRCWSILPGAAQAETLAVNLTINVNPDRTVRDVSITDKARYQSDGFFRAAADNAIRAIKHPDCTPLDLPVDKYSTWKNITLNFDPGTMF